MDKLASRVILLLAGTSLTIFGCGGGGGGTSATPNSNLSSSSGTSSSGSTSSSTSSSSGSSTSSSSSSGSSGTSTSSGGATVSSAKVIFLHHSTGGVIWDGGVQSSLSSYNTAHGTSYQITERSFPSSNYPAPGGWQNYAYDYWNIWVNGGGGSEPTLEELTAQYDVIVWKHCFPGSDVLADTGSPSVSSSRKSLENYKLQYAALKTKMRSFPTKKFIVWTPPAQIASATNFDNATRAQQFSDWVKNTWDEKGDNIFVWDFRQLETEGVDGGRYLLSKYSQGDSHPNATLANLIAPYLSQRIVDVINGRGDTGSITGH